MRAIRLLACLGVLAQVILIYSYRYELSALLQGHPQLLPLEVLPLFFSPIVLGLGGAAVAGALQRRGSAWAWPAVALPILILVLWYGAALYVTINPLDLG